MTKKLNVAIMFVYILADKYYIKTLRGGFLMEKKQKKIGKGGTVIGIAAILIIVALLGIIIYLLISRNAEPEEERRNVVITPENVESVLQEIEESQESVAPGYYTVTMNPTWHFAKGNDVSYDAVVINAETNTNDVYFDIVLENDEETVLYKSPVIPIGGRLEEIAMDESLETGTYDCVVIYHLVDEEQNTLSTLRVTLQIVVEG